MNLTETPKVVNLPTAHYLCVEKVGPFMETAQAAWTELRKTIPDVQKKNEVTQWMSLYQFEPDMVYCAGVSVSSKPSEIPSGLKYISFQGGKYACFTLTGSYMNLPEACGRVFEIIEETNLDVRDGAYYGERYVNSPDNTPEDQLITEILIPLN